MNPSWLKNHDVRIIFSFLLLNYGICDNILLLFYTGARVYRMIVHFRVSLQNLVQNEFSFQTVFVTNHHLEIVDFV